jgi:hypothetical protein
MNCQLNPYDAAVRADSRLAITRGAASHGCAAHFLRNACMLSSRDSRYRCPNPCGGRNYQLAVS